MSTGNGKDSGELKMLIKLMGMTGSNSDHEALNALRMANKWLNDKGHNWHDLLTGLVTVEADPFAAAPTVTINVGQAPRYAASAPPPPPKHFDNISEIESYFTKMELKMGLPSSIQTRINNIEKAWKANGYLLFGDYDYLRKQAKSRVKY